jgi:osmotically-inducible protein OsmY
MKHLIPLSFVIALAIAGCGNTADGVQKDATENSQKMSDSTKDATDKMKSGSAEAGAAISLTPAIKAAIVANPFLSESGNLIDVDSTAEAVTLKGHVKTEKAKNDAEELAKKIMTDKNATQPLHNELTIQP